LGQHARQGCIKHHSIMWIKPGISLRPQNPFWRLNGCVENVQIGIWIQGCRCKLNEKLTVKHFGQILVSYTSRKHDLIIICMDSSISIHVWGSIVIHRLRKKRGLFKPTISRSILTTFCTKGLYGKHNKLNYRWLISSCD
jgi:hypothetical protein